MSDSADRLSPAFVLTRHFKAPRHLLFAAFTEAAHLRQWMAPSGFEMVRCEVDALPGGVFHYGLRAPGGAAMWGKWTFREVVAPERLVVVVQFSETDGGVSRHPMAPIWPLYTLSTTTLADDGPAGTLLTLRWQTLNAAADEEATFNAAHAGMAQGWGGTMDQLDAHLAKSQAGAWPG